MWVLWIGKTFLHKKGLHAEDGIRTHEFREEHKLSVFSIFFWVVISGFLLWFLK